MRILAGRDLIGYPPCRLKNLRVEVHRSRSLTHVTRFLDGKAADRIAVLFLRPNS